MGLGSAMGAAAIQWEIAEADREQKRKLEEQHKRIVEGSLATEAAYKGVIGADNTFTPDPTATEGGANYKSKTITDAQLLDSIAKNEGTYKTGYNTEYAYGAHGTREKELKDMTLYEILDYQDAMVVNQKGSDLPSSAIGRYQMLRKTLREEMGHADLDGSELFTDSLQDKLIMQRLKRMRHYDDWRSGKYSDDKFKYHLAGEFASINNPYSGKGRHGQGSKPLAW